MITSLIWDPGHGGIDPGASFGDVKEKDITLDIALRCQRIMRACNRIKVMLTRVSDVTMHLNDRVKFVNEVRPSCMISIHTNADLDDDKPGMPEARGAEIWIDNVGKFDLPIATAMMRGLTLEFPDEPWRGIKQSNLKMVSAVLSPACLVEVAFIDNSASNRKLKDPLVREQIAFALVEGALSL